MMADDDATADKANKKQNGNASSSIAIHLLDTKSLPVER